MKFCEKIANALCDSALTLMVMVIASVTITMWCGFLVPVKQSIMLIIWLTDGVVSVWAILTFVAAVYLNYLEYRENRIYIIK